MCDKDWVDSINKIDNPIDMLKAIVDNEHFLGYDSYYKDLRWALIENSIRILKENYEK
ncbi:MAG: hypothetical protein ACHQ1D_00445 [Nitrososphaerales archaeon]